VNRYFWLLIRFVNDDHGPEERLVIYERAREAFFAQLYNAVPPLSDESVTFERLAFEEAVRTVEASITRWGRAPSPAEPVAEAG
jgi:hypothetical protein